VRVEIFDRSASRSEKDGRWHPYIQVVAQSLRPDSSQHAMENCKDHPEDRAATPGYSDCASAASGRVETGQGSEHLGVSLAGRSTRALARVDRGSASG
jgi:hypothetical protein